MDHTWWPTTIENSVTRLGVAQPPERWGARLDDVNDRNLITDATYATAMLPGLNNEDIFQGPDQNLGCCPSQSTEPNDIEDCVHTLIRSEY